MKKFMIYLKLFIMSMMLVTMFLHTNSCAARSTLENDAYYFYSPEIGTFKMSPSRARGGGDYSTTLHTFNIKDDDMQRLLAEYNKSNSTSLTGIHWYLKKGDGSKAYHTWNGDDYALGVSAVDKYTTTTNYYVKEQTYENTTGSGSFTLKTGQGKSYTVMLDTNKGHVTIDINGASIKDLTEYGTGDYYLIGNFENTGATINIDPTQSANRFKMSQTLYPIGTTDVSAADSVVYSVNVSRPANGWSQLYMAIASQTILDNLGTVTSGTEWQRFWNKVIRPQVQDDYDATATHGGLFIHDTGTGDVNHGGSQNQALNPSVSNDIEAYTLTFNATTNTYNIVYHTGLYIMGPAASSTDGAGSWNKDDAIKLTYSETDNCWTGTDINFTKGSKFRFADDKSMLSCYAEASTASAPGEVNTSNELKNEDTQYVNQVKWYNEGYDTHDEFSSDNNKTVNDITFLLESGKYTVKFYSKQMKDAAGKDISRIYYVIERPFNFYCPTSNNAKNLTSYRYFKAYSNYDAMTKPDGVDMFTVSNTDETNKTMTLTKLDLAYIPANMGVILASGGTFSTSALSKAINVYSDPWQSYTFSGTNLLVPCVVSKHIETTDGDAKYNYVFGYKRLGTDTDVTLGFYKPGGTGNCSANTAYLQTSTNVTTGAKGYMMVMQDDDVTGINNDIAIANKEEDNNYYTLQGTKVQSASMKGIYIHNGKKIIIK